MLTTASRALKRWVLGGRPVEFQGPTPKARRIEAIFSLHSGRPVSGKDMLDVIEHVSDQRLHLEEVHRVLWDGELCYRGTPNKTSPITRGHGGNDLVLRYPQMRPLFEAPDFRVTEVSTDVFLQPERYSHSVRPGRLVPRRLAEALTRWYPSQMFVLAKGGTRC